MCLHPTHVEFWAAKNTGWPITAAETLMLLAFTQTH